MSEAELQTTIVHALQRMGWFAFVAQRADKRARGKVGLPDIYAHKNGRMMWIEVKCGKNKLSPGQIDFRDNCNSHNIEWYEVRSIDDLMDIPRVMR